MEGLFTFVTATTELVAVALKTGEYVNLFPSDVTPNIWVAEKGDSGKAAKMPDMPSAMPPANRNKATSMSGPSGNSGASGSGLGTPEGSTEDMATEESLHSLEDDISELEDDE